MAADRAGPSDRVRGAQSPLERDVQPRVATQFGKGDRECAAIRGDGQ